MAGKARNQEAAMLRRAAIVDLARNRGSVAVADLPEKFAVSVETIRRDLRYLEDRQQIIRAYGTLRAVESGAFETTLQHRVGNFAEEKQRIGVAAAAELGAASTIFLDEGYLPFVLGQQIPADRERTVVTTSLTTALELSVVPHLTVVAVGGRVRATTKGVVDFWATQMLASMEIDIAFIGANGISEKGWLTTPDPTVAATKRAAMDAARTKVFVGDHSKFGRSTFTRFGTLSEFDQVITGKELRESTADRYSALGPQIRRV